MKDYKGRLSFLQQIFEQLLNQASAKMTELPECAPAGGNEIRKAFQMVPRCVMNHLNPLKGTRDGLVYSRMILPKI